PAIHRLALHLYSDVASTGADEPVIVTNVHVPVELHTRYWWRLSRAPRPGGALGSRRPCPQTHPGRRDGAGGKRPDDDALRHLDLVHVVSFARGGLQGHRSYSRVLADM